MKTKVGFGVVLLFLGVFLGGCASTPPQESQESSDKSFGRCSVVLDKKGQPDYLLCCQFDYNQADEAFDVECVNIYSIEALQGGEEAKPRKRAK